MCGFSGSVHWSGEPVDREELSEQLRHLKHRGPDELQMEFPESYVGLAHARLKVIDLSGAARQPMTDENRSVWICFNGEIYNFQELRTELQAMGCRFHSRSDTEVILRAYQSWGEEAIQRLDGMFSIALWDSRRRHLLLARDRTGKKPLFYWTDGRCLTFGSEIKALFPHSHVPRLIDEQALPHLLALGYPPPGRSCYREIRQVPPAAYIRFEAGQVQSPPRPYWKIPFPETSGAQSLPRKEEELRQLLTSAVRRRLISDVPLGAFLSGGLDSTIVTGVMASLLPAGALKTFSIGFEGDRRFDETRYARLAAGRLRAEHTVFTITPQPFGLIERLVWHHDQPFGDSSALPTFLLSQLARSRVTVALTGDGGDELFAGYDRFRACLLAERIPLGIRSASARLLGNAARRFHVRSAAGRAGKFLQAGARPPAERFLRWSGFFPSDPAVWEPYEQSMQEWKGFSLLSRLLRLNFETYLANDLHVKTDRCSMAHGLEARSPFLDTALVEWAFRAPDSLKLRGRIGKWILRRAFARQIPGPILRRPKAGFGVPLDAWFRTSWKNPLRELLSPRSARVHRYLPAEEVGLLIQQHLEGKGEHGQKLWLLATLEIWLRQMERPQLTPPGAAGMFVSKESAPI